MKDLPQWLNKEAWAEWAQFRKEIKKKLVQTTISRQLKFLERHKDIHVLILEQSIQNGWTGLFETKNKSVNDGEVKFENFMDMKEHLSANFEAYKLIDIKFEAQVWRVGRTGIAYSKANIDDMPYDQRKRFWIYMINNRKLLENAIKG